MIQVWVHFCSADFTATKLPTLNHFPIRSYRRLQNISLESIYPFWIVKYYKYYKYSHKSKIVIFLSVRWIMVGYIRNVCEIFYVTAPASI